MSAHAIHPSIRRAASAALAGVLILAPAGQPLSAETPGENKPPAYSPKSEGFTRESMAELSRPEPLPAPPGPLISPRVARSRVDAKDFVPHRVSSSRRVARAEVDGKDYNPSNVVRVTKRAAGSKKEEKVAVRPRLHRRNPAESFVYWWNGWVIRTFHTRVGTVLLGTIGAQS